MSSSQAVVVPSYQVVSVGALPTPWVPPSSCLSTTTSFNGQLWQGTIGSLGTDPACYPPQTTSVALGAQITSTGSALSARDAGNTIALYSPGICPYGWIYVASFVTSNVEATSASTRRTVSIASAGTEATTYFCCPGGYYSGVTTRFEPVTLTPGPSPTIAIDYLSCTAEIVGKVTNVWSLETASEWPTAVPSNLKLSVISPVTPSCTTWTVTASGIAVAWAPTDTLINDILANGSYAFINVGLFEGLPAFPPAYPSPSHTPTNCPSPGSSHIVVGSIIPAAILAVLLLLCIGCCCVGIGRTAARRRRLAGGTMPRPAGYYYGGGGAAAGRWKPQREDQIPLNAMGPAPVAAYIPREAGQPTAPGRYEPMRDVADDRPPAYDDTLMMGDANLDASSAMGAGRVDGGYGHGGFGRG